MHIRSVDMNESDKLATLIRAAYQANPIPGVHFAAAHLDDQMMQQHLKFNAAYVVELENQFVSTISLRLPWGNNPGPFGVPHIGWFATHPDYTQQGIGIKLFNWLEQQILESIFKLPAVTLGTAENHPWLISFYQKQGFKPIAKANLGHGHITLYFEKILDNTRYQYWQSKRNQIIAQGFELNDRHITIERIK